MIVNGCKWLKIMLSFQFMMDPTWLAKGKPMVFFDAELVRWSLHLPARRSWMVRCRGKRVRPSGRRRQWPMAVRWCRKNGCHGTVPRCPDQETNTWYSNDTDDDGDDDYHYGNEDDNSCSLTWSCKPGKLISDLQTRHLLEDSQEQNRWTMRKKKHPLEKRGLCFVCTEISSGDTSHESWRTTDPTGDSDHLWVPLWGRWTSCGRYWGNGNG